MQEFVVVGQAQAGRPDARRAALDDAIRSVVSRIGGPRDLGADAVDALLLQHGAALAGCEGSISAWKITDARTVGEMLELTVKFQLLPNTLREELMETSFREIDPEVLYDWVGRPRVLVALKESMDGEPDERRQGTTALEDALLSRSVEVFSREQVEALIQREQRLAAIERPQEAARLGEQLGAELVVSGSFTSDFSRETPPLSFGSNKIRMQFYTSYLQTRLVESTTGRILVSRQWDNSDPGDADLGRMGKHDAAIVSKRHLVDEHTGDLIAAIAGAWHKRVLEGQSIRVQVHGVAGGDLAALDRALGDLPRVGDVRRRSFMEGAAATYDLRYTGQQSSLEEALTDMRRPRLALERSERSSIAVRVRKDVEPAAALASEQTLEVVSRDHDPQAVRKLAAWLESQKEVRRVEPVASQDGGLRAVLGGRLTSGELFRRLTEGAVENFDAVGLDRNRLQVRRTRSSGSEG